MRTHNALRVYLLTFGAVLLAPLLAAAQHLRAPGAPATGPYLDTNSGMIFPVMAGEFKRFRITRGDGPQDISAGYFYSNQAARLSATVFVHRLPVVPGTNNCRQLADGERRRAQKDHSDAVFSDLTAPPTSGYSSVAYSSRYETRNAGGGDRQLLLLCRWRAVAGGVPLSARHLF